MHCPHGRERSHFNLRRLQMVQERGGLRRRGGDFGEWSSSMALLDRAMFLFGGDDVTDGGGGLDRPCQVT